MSNDGRPFKIAGADGNVIAIPPGEFYFNAKARCRRMMKNSLSPEARRVYACLELATMGFQQELAVTMSKGKPKPLTRSDIAGQTRLSEQHVRRGLVELEKAGLAERRGKDDGPLLKGKVEIYSWAEPRAPKEQNGSQRAAPIPDWFPEAWKPLRPLVKRLKIQLPPDIGATLGSLLNEGERAARELENAEKGARSFLKRISAAPPAYKEERTERKIERTGPRPDDSDSPGSHHHQQKEILENALASLAVEEISPNRTETEAVANGGARTNPLSESRKADDDEKPAQTSAAPETPTTVFLFRVAQRHSEIDASACFADVQGELRKGAIPLDAFLRRDLLTTTNPKALTNPRGYYRGLAKTMVAEHQKQMAGIPTASLVETPRCEKCNGGGYLLKHIEGQRPLQTGEFCACKLGEDLAAIERRAAKKAAAAGERKQPPQAPSQASLPAGGLQ